MPIAKAKDKERQAVEKMWENYDKEVVDLSYEKAVPLVPGVKFSPTLYYKWRKRWLTRTSNDKFDLRKAYLGSQEIIWNQFLEAVKVGKISPNVFRTFAQLAGELVERKEESVKVEFTVSDRIRIATEYRDALRREFNDTGYCPVCKRCQEVCTEVCMDSESEHSDDREMETLAIPARLT